MLTVNSIFSPTLPSSPLVSALNGRRVKKKVGVNFISLLIFSTLSHLNLAGADSALAWKVFNSDSKKTIW